MIFKSEPNLFCRINNKYVQRATGMKGFYFDDKGEYETKNEVLIRVLSQSFKVVEEIEPVEEPEAIEETPKPIKHCKKCDFTCTNQGDLMSHYRHFHAKEEN